MTTTSSIQGSSAGVTSTAEGTTKAFRNADFLRIMLTEVTSQNPFDPQETSKLVENMQKLQDLANSTYTKFRADVKWANDLMGQDVRVQQQTIDPKEVQAQKDKGLKPDVGYGQITGKVESFRVVDEAVWVTVKGKDYPIDNLKQIIPKNNDATYLATMADQLLGKTVVYRKADGSTAGGTVGAVKYDQHGDLAVQVGQVAVPYKDVVQIGGG